MRERPTDDRPSGSFGPKGQPAVPVDKAPNHPRRQPQDLSLRANPGSGS